MTIGDLFKDPNNNKSKNSVYNVIRGGDLTWGRGLNPVVVEICLKKDLHLRDEKKRKEKTKQKNSSNLAFCDPTFSDLSEI